MPITGSDAGRPGCCRSGERALADGRDLSAHPGLGLVACGDRYRLLQPLSARLSPDPELRRGGGRSRTRRRACPGRASAWAARGAAHPGDRPRLELARLPLPEPYRRAVPARAYSVPHPQPLGRRASPASAFSPPLLDRVGVDPKATGQSVHARLAREQLDHCRRAILGCAPSRTTPLHARLRRLLDLGRRGRRARVRTWHRPRLRSECAPARERQPPGPGRRQLRAPEGSFEAGASPVRSASNSPISGADAAGARCALPRPRAPPRGPVALRRAWK